MARSGSDAEARLNILFPFGVRLSTWLGVVAFLCVALARRDRVPLYACLAWLLGFEAAFQIASLALGRLPVGSGGPIFVVAAGAVALPWLTRRGARPSWWLLAPALALLAVWAALGLPQNDAQRAMFSLHPHIAHFDATGEVLNEVVKILWALAYFLPLTRSGEAALSVNTKGHTVAGHSVGT